MVDCSAVIILVLSVVMCAYSEATLAPHQFDTPPTNKTPSSHHHPIELIIEQRLEEMRGKNVEGMPVHFGITMPTYPRSNDRYYLLPRATAIRSLLNQTFTNWTLFIGGDGLTVNMTRNLFATLQDVPKHKYVFQNVPSKETERHIYAHRAFAPCSTARRGREAWCHSGTSAYNLALRTAIDAPHVTHISILADDDFYFPNHLEDVVKAYEKYPRSHFTYSRGYYLGSLFPTIPVHKYKVNNFVAQLAEASNSISSLWTWKLSNDPELANMFFFHHDFTQLKRNPGRNKHRAYANDADLQFRINSYASKHNLTDFSVYIPRPAGVAFPKNDRHLCINILTKNYESGVDTDVVEECNVPQMRQVLGYGPKKSPQLLNTTINKII